MTDVVGGGSAMSRRDVEQWLLGAAGELAELRVKAELGRGPDLGSGEPPSWISLSSELGSGRVVRGGDGKCRVDARRHADGVVLIERSSSVTTSVELDVVVRALTPE